MGPQAHIKGNIVVTLPQSAPGPLDDKNVALATHYLYLDGSLLIIHLPILNMDDYATSDSAYTSSIRSTVPVYIQIHLRRMASPYLLPVVHVRKLLR